MGVEQIEMGTLNPSVEAGSGDYRYDHHQPESNFLQERDSRRAASTNMDIEICIVVKADHRNIIDDDSR